MAGVSSGCGKTTVALGIMAALRQRGNFVQPFKCGPDFIDTTLHTMVTGNTSWNLDVRMCGKTYVRNLFGQEATTEGINVIEGVMGLFDGGEASAASLAALLSVPVVLVVDASSAAESIAAIIRGFEEMISTEKGISGVVLNKVASPRHVELIKGAVSRYCCTRIIGAIPRERAIEIPSRHLGLFMGEEKPLKDLSSLSDIICQHLDMDILVKISKDCKGPGQCPPAFSSSQDNGVKGANVQIGIARDQAFCFYYEDNLRIFESAGASLVPFSPLKDEGLPRGISGLYLGGGYPELFAEQLSENKRLRQEIKDLSWTGMPIFAECGGFMYLCRSITDIKGQDYDMAGVFPADARMQKRLASLGYRDITIDSPCPLGGPGDRLHGHEFHYSVANFNGPVEKIFSMNHRGKEGYRIKNTIAGYVHIHFGSTPQAPAQFVNTCQAMDRNRSCE